MLDRLFLGKMATVDVTNTQFQTGLTVLKGASLISQAQSDAITAMGTVNQSIAQQNNLPEVKEGWIEMARAK
jgi:hypothetical protein